MTYTNPGLFQDDTEGGREGFCDQLCQKRRLSVFPSSMADKMSLLMRRRAVSVPMVYRLTEMCPTGYISTNMVRNT